MSIPAAYLVIALLTMAVHLWALRTQMRGRRSRTPAEKLAYRGLVRTASCRVAVGALYVTLGVIEVHHQTGVGTALVVFGCISSMWMCNAAADVVLRHRIAALPGILDLR